MLQRLERRHSLFWVPVQALHDEIKEAAALRAYDVLQRFAARISEPALRILEYLSRLI